jgi:hypothetical protein
MQEAKKRQQTRNEFPHANVVPEKLIEETAKVYTVAAHKRRVLKSCGSRKGKLWLLARVNACMFESCAEAPTS